MNRGLLLKCVREAWITTLLIGVALFLFEVIIAVVFPQVFDQLAEQLVRLPLFQTIIRVLLGTDIGDSLGPVAFLSIAWVHPVVLALLWTHEIVFATRLPVREIDRGTIDVLLGLPVSRWQAYVTESVVWLASGVVLLGLALAGHGLGCLGLEPEQRLDGGRLLGVLTNLFALYVAVGGLAYLVSACSERRGRAIGTVFGIVLASFFLNFLVPFWEPAGTVSFLGLLNYYQPLVALQQGSWPWADIAVLAGVGIGLWTLGGIVLARRDIRTT